MPEAPRHRPNLDNPVLRSRKPTAAVPYPMILAEGEEKSGKSWEIALAAADERIGRAFWLDLGEGAADEYAGIPEVGPDAYEVLEHDGTYAAVLEQVLAVKEVAKAAHEAGDKPVLLAIDSGSDIWNGLKDWVSLRARGSDKNKRKLAEDPAAELDVSRNLWNDAGKRYRKLMTELLTFPGIVVITARGKVVSATDPNTGQPYKDARKGYSVESHASLPYDATLWLRMRRDEPPMIVGARSVHLKVQPPKKGEAATSKSIVLEGRRQPPPDGSLYAWLVFDVLKCDPHKTHVRDLHNFTGGDLLPEEREGEEKEAAQHAPSAATFRAWCDDITVQGRENGDPRGALVVLDKLLERYGQAVLSQVGPLELRNGNKVNAWEYGMGLRQYLGTLPQKPEEGTSDEASLTRKEEPPAEPTAPTSEPAAAPTAPADGSVPADGHDGPAPAAAPEPPASDDAQQTLDASPSADSPRVQAAQAAVDAGGTPQEVEPKESARPRGTENLRPAPSNPAHSDWISELGVQAEARGFNSAAEMLHSLLQKRGQALYDVPRAVLKAWAVQGREQAIAEFEKAGLVDEAELLRVCPANSAATEEYVKQM